MRPSELEIFLRTIVARAYPRVMGINRNRSWLFFDLAFPLVGTFAMVFVYQGLHAPHQYLGFVVMGGGMLAFWQNVLWMMGTQFSWDRGNGMLELMAVSPTSFEAILLGMAGGGMILTAVRAAAIILIGSLLFGVNYTPSGLLPAIGVFLLTLAALLRDGDAAGQPLPLLFARGLAPWRRAPGAGQLPERPLLPGPCAGRSVGGAASLVPVTLGLDAMRQFLLPGTPRFLDPGLEALIVALEIPLFGFAAYKSLRFMEARARRDGKLISKWS